MEQSNVNSFDSMAPDSIEVRQAIRAMRCGKWAIAEGVLDLRGTRFSHLPDLSKINVVIALPDFRDERTRAHLAELVRAYYGGEFKAPQYVKTGVWRATVNKGGSLSTAEEPTEVDAYLFALEQA